MVVIFAKTADVVQVAAPVLAAVAASASWAAVWQSRKAFKTSLLPQLDGYWDNDSDASVRLEIHNTGGGVARDPYFYVIGEDRVAEGRIVKTGPLRPGQKQRLSTDLPRLDAGSEIVGVLCCLDWAGRWHVWSWDGRHKRLRDRLRRSPHELDVTKALRLMHPKASLGELAQGTWDRIAER